MASFIKTNLKHLEGQWIKDNLKQSMKKNDLVETRKIILKTAFDQDEKNRIQAFIVSLLQEDSFFRDSSEIFEIEFACCDLLESIIIPTNITTIGDFAFAFCRNLTNITIPESVKNIGNYAFFGCEKLKTITIPKGLLSIGKNAFPPNTKVESK